LPFCVGNFPQLVREWHTLLAAPALRQFQPAGGPSAVLPSLQRWADQAAHQHPYPYPLVALGVLRLAKQFAGAAQLLQHAEATDPGAWRDALANEAAALAWHQGRVEEAASLWESQPPTAPVLFNRGMAALFLDRAVQARAWLEQAVSHLADDNAWYHLGRLYLTLAELRG
jgi:tetratricopeptide (TPR) repeat protein